MFESQKHPLRIAMAALFMAAAGSAVAQSAASFPTKPILVVIPFAPGGAVTTIIAAIQEPAVRDLGQPMVADYRPGGDTAVGVGVAARAVPDGHTLLLGTSSYLVNHFLADLPFDTLKDLTPVAMAGRSTYVVAAYPPFAKTVADLVRQNKARPEGINFGYVGSVALVNAHRLMKALNVKFVPVSYKASPQITTDMLTGGVSVQMTGLASLQSLIKAGKLNALAVSGESRNPALPDVPTVREQGFDFSSDNWFAFVAPSKTPRPILQRLNTYIRTTDQSPAAVKLLGSIGVDPFPTTLEESERFIKSEADLYDKVVKDAGIPKQ